jgi:anti-anti-sigma factor
VPYFGEEGTGRSSGGKITMATSLKIDCNEYQRRVPVTVLKIKGDIDAITQDELQKQAAQAMEKGANYLLLDVTQVDYISSAGLRALKNIFDEINLKHTGSGPIGFPGEVTKSPYLKILNPSIKVQKSLQMVAFDRFLETFTDLEKAVSSF